MIVMVIGIILLLFGGAQAADVRTLIDMSTQEGAAFFSDVAVGQTQDAEQTSPALYFTDTHANCIRRWTSTDGLQELAGQCGHPGGFQDGRGYHALFSMPRGICYHPQGFLAVSDSQNACIRSISLDGEVDTLAGRCTHVGDEDGDASEALFSTAIDGIACLSNCSILVTDPSSRTVRIVQPDGVCPDVPGDDPKSEGWPYKKPLIWTASVLGVIAALGAGTLLLRPLIAKSLHGRISRKRTEVEEASHAAKPSEVGSPKGAVGAGRLANYDDSAYGQPRSSSTGAEEHQQAPLIILDAEDEEIGEDKGRDA